MQVPLPPWDKPARVQRQEARSFEFLKRVLVDGDETQECDQPTGIFLAGMALALLDVLHERTAGMTAEQARAASKRMIADQARLLDAQVAMLSTEDGSEEDDGAHPARRDSEGDS